MPILGIIYAAVLGILVTVMVVGFILIATTTKPKEENKEELSYAACQMS